MSTEAQIQTIEMFGELNKKERRCVARLMTTVKVKAGTDLMVEGEPGREFLIVLEGEATVHRGGKTIATVGTGDFLGELSVIAGVPRTATVTADTDMSLSVLSRREFMGLLDEQPRIGTKVLIGTVKRLHQLQPDLER